MTFRKPQVAKIGSLLAVLILAAISVNAQPEQAETLFAEAKSLAASAETVDKALTKFDEAAALFRTANKMAMYAEVELDHGRALRSIAVREMNAGRLDEAMGAFERALKKFRVVNNRLEMAYVYHDMGYIGDRRNQAEVSASFYSSALENYRAAGDRSGEAVILRNLGVVDSGRQKYEAALANFEAAMKIRTVLDEPAEQAQLSLDIGGVYESLNRHAEAVPRFDASVSFYRRAKDRKGEAAALYRLGNAQSFLSKHADAVTSLQNALQLYTAENDTTWIAYANHAIGRALMSDSKNAKAEQYLLKAIEMLRELKDVDGAASVELNLAINYHGMTRLSEAKAAMESSIAGFRTAENPLGEAYALLSYASLQSYLNLHDDALVKIRAAEKIFKDRNNSQGEHSIAAAYADHYYSLSNHGESIRYGLLAMAAAERNKQRPQLASAYIQLANSYSATGQHEKTIEFTTKALLLAREMNSRQMESIALSNLGYEHLLMKKYPEAESYFVKAIAIMRAEGFEREEGYSTHNLGLVFYARKEFAHALANYERALAIYRKTGDRRPEAFVYDSFGEVYRDQGLYDKAVENFQQAIVLAREIRYSDIEAQALGNMMMLWSRRGQPRLAVLYGKQAVNVYQSIRAVNKTLDKAGQKGFVQSNEKTYRRLANLLIDEGRLAEAQQVLDLLKAEEYFEFIRRDSSEANEHASLALNETERKALEEYSRVSNQLTSLGASFQTLQDKRSKSGGKLPEAEEAEYLKLKSQVEAAGEGLKTFFSKLANEFSKKVEDGTVVTPQSIETLKADLRRAGQDVVLVSTYLLPERYRAIVTTGRAMVDRKVEYGSLKLTGADINRKIFEFQRALQNPSVDPRPLAKELYDIFVKPLEGDLKGAGAKTILWSLDGSLRYIPMAALSPDGKTYLAERYQNVVVTLGRQTNLFAKPAADEWRAIGAGVSKQHPGFSALPSVPSEIGSIVRDTKAEAGVLDGTRLLDEQFNLESLRNTVPQQTDDGKPFNVLHLATHFSLGANDQDSALLLGDGTRLSLFEIGKDEALDFKDVELLTLSACQTGVSTGDANGREVESLGMLAQKKGAKAVLATLWKVADESTSLFMTEFYRIKKSNPTMNKAEAIRLAQKAMIDGRIKASGKSVNCRAEAFVTDAAKEEFKCDPNAPYSHPYFWSPFVLIGNWR